MIRTEVFRALVGSHNYNLDDETSDKDYKIFTLPTFDDLYFGKMYSKQQVGQKVDFSAHDIRKLPELFWKANINFLETLYSTETDIKTYNHEVCELFSLRDQIVTMNLPYLYNACKGMHFEKMKRLDKSSEGTQHLINKYGYNTKEALHAFRVLDFIARFAFSDFTDFGWALRYSDFSRDELLGIKNGFYCREEFERLVKAKYELFEKFERQYHSKMPNKELMEYIKSLIYKMIYKHILQAEVVDIEYNTFGGN